MTLYLHRHHQTRYGLEGQLFINRQEVCDTLEHPIHHLPRGSYPIEIRHNDKLFRKTPFIKPMDSEDTPLPSMMRTRRLPYIGIGNGPFLNTNGTILVGKLTFPGLILQSADIFSKLIDRLDKAQNRGETITLNIE